MVMAEAVAIEAAVEEEDIPEAVTDVFTEPVRDRKEALVLAAPITKDIPAAVEEEAVINNSPS